MAFGLGRSTINGYWWMLNQVSGGGGGEGCAELACSLDLHSCLLVDEVFV